MFTVRTIFRGHPTARPKPNAVPADVMAYISRMRLRAASDVELAKLLNEMDGLLPASGPQH